MAQDCTRSCSGRTRTRSASDHVPGWAPSPCRLPGPVPRYVQVSVGFSPPRLQQAPPPERQKRCAGQGVRGSSGVRASGRLFLKSYYGYLSSARHVHVHGHTYVAESWGAGAFQTQSWFFLQSWGEGVRGSVCTGVLVSRVLGRHDIVLRNSTTRPNPLPAAYKSIMHPRCTALSRACGFPSTAPRPIGIREPNLYCPWARFRGG